MTRSKLALLSVCIALAPLATARAADTASPQPIVGHPLRFAVSAPLREILELPARPTWEIRETEFQRPIPKPNLGRVVDVVEQTSALPSVNYSVGTSFLGLGNGFPGFNITGAPPDTNMAVGDTQIVEWINSSFAVFDKSGHLLGGPTAGNLLWQNLGGECFNNNDGDPIAQFDKAHHRWLLAQNVFHLPSEAPPFYACVAVSTSPDALGSYYLYQFPLGNEFPDYPKWGVWSNGYYQSQNDFVPRMGAYIAPKICAYNDAKLRIGDQTAEQVCFELSAGDGGVQPADIDSAVPPPGTQDEFFFTIWDSSHLAEYSMHVDYNDPMNSSVTGNNGSQLIAVPAFNPACQGSFGPGPCVPELGGEELQVLGFDMMYRIVYYDDTPALNATATPPLPAPLQHWLLLHDAESNSGNESPRWYELTAQQRAVPVTSLNLFQSGTYSPDSNFRWMGSIARDKKYNILLGFSESSATTHPSIAVAGRVLTDPLGTLESEVNVINGTGSQIATQNRWGDYSAMRLDPADGCTLWYISEYYMMTAQFAWSTEIASTKFNNCH